MSKKKYYIMWCGLALLVLMACGNTDIPSKAQSFLNQYFPLCSVVLISMDDDEGEMEYKVWLNDGTKVEFDLQGDLKQVTRNKTGVPAELIPDSIEQYVKTYFPHDIVTKFCKKNYGYKLELSDDLDLRFNKQYQFMEKTD